MFVLHAAWTGGALHLWAEDSGGARPPRRGARSARAAQRHPAAAPQPVLLGLLTGLPEPAGPLAREGVVGDLTLWLPSTPAGPLASPELIVPPDAVGHGGPRTRRALAAWRVPTLGFAPGPALALLTVAEEPGALADDAVAAGTVHYLAALARFAADLAGRGRVVPALAAEGSGYAARWRPVLSGADATWAAELAMAMPPVIRAAETSVAGERSVPVLNGVLDALADAAVRARLGEGWSPLPARRGRRPAKAGLAERWLGALTAGEPGVALSPGDERDAAGLARDLAAWRDAAQAPAGPVRTCFRLVEPEPAGDGDGQGPWRVEFALQSTDDPSLMVGAPAIWAANAGPAAAIAAAGAAHPDELLLTGLGRAARLFPALAAELRSAAPVAVTLDTEGAFTFLRQVAPVLSGAGFGVLLPAWARRSRLGLKLTTRSAAGPGASASGPAFGMKDLVEFRYDLAVGDQVLDPAELDRLADLKVPLVRLRGQWVELDEAHLRAALRFIERERSGTMTPSEAMLAGLRGGDENLPLVEVDADGWLGDLLSGQADRRLAPVPAPASFAGTLRAYQERGLAWLAFLGGLGLGGVLADDMGLGKTVQILALLAHERERPGEDTARSRGPALLVCPMSLAGNWQREAERFTPHLRVHVHHGSDRLRGGELATQAAGSDLVITTYGVAVRDREHLAAIGWSRVICDEAQNIKNHSTHQARAVRALPAGSRVALTGTPVENRLSDLWSLMEFTAPGVLGGPEKFRRAFAVPIERGGDEDAAAALRRMTRPFVLRRLKTDPAIISDLPDKLEMKVWCNLTPEQASLYQATVSDMMGRIESEPDEVSRRGLVLATMAKLKQVCNHPAHLLGDGSRLPGRSGKLARLEEICDEIVAAGDKVLCFSQFAEFARLLQPHLAARLGCPVLFLHGGTPKKQRDTMVSRFQDARTPAVFLLSLKAGGTGLNLTAANHVIHVDRWWNPAVEDQATDRAFRIGQRKDVQVRKFICVGTLEERIDRMIEDKKALAQRVVAAGESWLAGLSAAELRAVIELSPDAVSQ